MAVSDILLSTLKDSTGRTIGIFNEYDKYFQGVLLGCDDSYLKLNDRKLGVIVIRLNEIKDVRFYA